MLTMAKETITFNAQIPQTKRAFDGDQHTPQECNRFLNLCSSNPDDDSPASPRANISGTEL